MEGIESSSPKSNTGSAKTIHDQKLQDKKVPTYYKFHARHENHNQRSNWREHPKRQSTSRYPSQGHHRKQMETVEKYIYGNFPHYYGYRNQDSPDMRLTCMKKEWFEGKEVLDVGCNAGHFTLSIARDFSPKLIIGLDIDPKLVLVSKKNTKHYIKEYSAMDDDSSDEDCEYPLSFVTLYGPVALSVFPEFRNRSHAFPFNVFFVQGNYVPESDDIIVEQKPCLDTILCLSLTKWVHLNWGDDGMKRLFHRAYAQLRPGGYFILEAQPYSSYSKKKKISPQARFNFMNIKFYPEMFNEFLLKEVGFETCELVDVPAHSSKGFSRPIYLFTKSLTPKNILAQAPAGPIHVHFDSDDDEQESSPPDTDPLSDVELSD